MVQETLLEPVTHEIAGASGEIGVVGASVDYPTLGPWQPRQPPAKDAILLDIYGLIAAQVRSCAPVSRSGQAPASEPNLESRI